MFDVPTLNVHTLCVFGVYFLHYSHRNASATLLFVPAILLAPAATLQGHFFNYAGEHC